MSLQRVREQQLCLNQFLESISTLKSQQKFTIKQQDYDIWIFEQNKVYLLLSKDQINGKFDTSQSPQLFNILCIWN